VFRCGLKPFYRRRLLSPLGRLADK